MAALGEVRRQSAGVHEPVKSLSRVPVAKVVEADRLAAAQKLQDLHRQGSAVVGLGRRHQGRAIRFGPELVVQQAQCQIGCRVVLDPVELVLNADEVESELLLQLEQGEVDLHLEQHHLAREVFDRIGSETDVHSLLDEEGQGVLGSTCRDLLGHLHQAQSVEPLPGDPEDPEEVGLRDLVPHLHRAWADRAIDRALQLLPDLPCGLRRLRSNRDLDRFGLRRRVGPVLQEVLDRVGVVRVILEPLDEAAAGLDTHLRGAGGGGEEPDRAGVVGQATSQHELRDAPIQLIHRAHGEIGISPTRDEVQEPISPGVPHGADPLGDARDGSLRVEDVRLPPALLDHADQLAQLLLGDRPHLAVGLRASIQGHVYVDGLRHRSLLRPGATRL